MNTKKLGDMGIGRAISCFTELGWTVCIPITDSQDYDLVIDMPQLGLKSIQVKYISREVRPGVFQAKIAICGGTKGIIWKLPSQLIFDYLFVAAGDGSNWLIPRDKIKTSIDIGRFSRNKEFEFGKTKRMASAASL